MPFPLKHCQRNRTFFTIPILKQKANRISKETRRKLWTNTIRKNWPQLTSLYYQSAASSTAINLADRASDYKPPDFYLPPTPKITEINSMHELLRAMNIDSKQRRRQGGRLTTEYYHLSIIFLISSFSHWQPFKKTVKYVKFSFKLIFFPPIL